MSALVGVASFFGNEQVRTALVAGTTVAMVAGAVGVFVVVRGQSFAGHALADMGTLGGSAAEFMTTAPLWGYLVVGLFASVAMEAVGAERKRGRDIATGVVLGAALGVSALLLYLDAIGHSTTGAVTTVVFGSLFTVPSSEISVMVAVALGGVLALLVLHRPLMLASVSPELAQSRGVPLRFLSTAFLMLAGISVALSAMVVGTILATALLVGPAATALRVVRSPHQAMASSCAIGAASVWLGVYCGYESSYWPPAGHHWPVSFFVVVTVFVLYLVSGLGFHEPHLSESEEICDEHELSGTDSLLVHGAEGR